MSGWLGTTWLIAARELRLGLRARSFRITTALLVVAVAAAILIPAAVHGHPKTHKVGVVGSTAAAQLTVRTAARIYNATVQTVAFSDLAAAEAALRDGGVEVVLVPGREVLIARAPYAGVPATASSLEGALALAGGLVGHAGAVTAPAPAPSLPIRGLTPPLTGLSVRLTGLAISIVMYMIILLYGSRIAIGVSEEKQSRVVEVLLAAVRPTQLLLGKVIGLGALALVQALAILVTFVVLGEATGSSLLHSASLDVVAVGALWIVVGYAFYCTAFAAAGSLVTKASDATNVSMPVQLPLIASYILTFTVLYGDSVPAYYWFLAYFPPTAPVSMTVLVAMGAVEAWQVALSVVLTLAATVGMAWAAGRIYGHAILHTGSRLRWRQAWRREA